MDAHLAAVDLLEAMALTPLSLCLNNSIAATSSNAVRSMKIIARHFERFADGEGNKRTGQPGDCRPSPRVCPAVFRRQQSTVTPLIQHEGTPMYILKLIFLTIAQLVKQAWLLPQSIANAVKQRRRLVVRNELEAERLDRIRNPSKYLGK